MTVYAVISILTNQQSKSQLEKAISDQFPNNFLQIADNSWLVSDKGTSKDISDKLKITAGENGGGFVFAIGAYFGRANPDVWAWLKTKFEQLNDV